MDKTDKIIKLANAMRIDLKEESNKLVVLQGKYDQLKDYCMDQKSHILRLAQELGDVNAEVCRLKKMLKDLDVNKVDQAEDDALELRQNGRNPLTVFPEEVWELIFDNLENPKDLRNSYDGHPLFRSILQENLNITDVMRILAARGDLGCMTETTNELLKYRLVSRSWKKSIDSLFLDENFAPIFPGTSTEFGFKNGFEHPKLLFKLTKNPWEDEWIRKMNANKNPMVSRFLEYVDPMLPWFLIGSNYKVSKGDQKFRQDFIKFLKKFGHHVWYFKTETGDDDPELKVSEPWVTVLNTGLSLLPNLRALHICRPEGSPPDWLDDETDNTDEHYESTISDSDQSLESTHSDNENSASAGRSRVKTGHPMPEETDNLKEQLLSEGFPTVKSLTTVLLEDCYAEMLTSLLAANPQIERLTIKRNGIPDTSGLKQINLTELKEVFVDHGECSEIENIKCPLRKLTVLTNITRGSRDDLYNSLRTYFGETLVELTLNCWERWEPSKLSYDPVEKYKNSQWKSLKKLTVMCTKSVNRNLSAFFQSLNKSFGAVITELDLQFSDGTKVTNEDFPRLIMPNLRILNLEIGPDCHSIDFLLPLLGLETLNVVVKLLPRDRGIIGQEDDIFETINLYQFVNTLEKSNIWQLLPKLNKVRVRTDHLVSRGVLNYEVKKTTCQFCSRSQLGEK